MPAIRTAFIILILCSLSALAAERSRSASLQAPSAQGADRERAGGLRQIQPGHYVYLHTDDTPGVSSTFNSGIIVTSDGVVVSTRSARRR